MPVAVQGSRGDGGAADGEQSWVIVWLLGVLILSGCAEAGGAGDPGTLGRDNPGSRAVVLKRLTYSQYRNSLADLLGSHVSLPPAPEPDVKHEGFQTVGGSVGAVSRRGVEQTEGAAFGLADQVLGAAVRNRDAFVGCAPKAAVDADCAQAFVRRFGRRAYRRSLSDEEIQRWTTVATHAAETLGDFHEGLKFAVAGILQSPHFLYRVEAGEPLAGRPGMRAYTDDEMAGRLSFFLWNTTPDDALLDAAARGELTRTETLAPHVDRLLASPRARHAVRNFFAEMFALYDLDDLVKDGETFKAMSADLGPSAREETLRLIEDVIFERQADYREVFTSRRTFVNRKLAALYGVAAPKLDDFGEIALSVDDPRRGILGHASLLALYAHPTSTSATLRGKFIRTVLLCGEIPPPPAELNTALPDVSESGPTMRDRVRVHTEVASCARCHLKMDPLGLALEQFDGLGQWRDRENGERIDPSGDLDGRTFSDARGLAEAIREHPNLAACVARHLFRYATGVLELTDNDPEIEALAGQFVKADWRFLSLLRAVALSAGFRHTMDPR